MFLSPSGLSSPSRISGSLDPVCNDTGRVAFCGPYVLAGLTGRPISKMETAIRAARGIPDGEAHIVKGTYAEEVAAVLALFDYRMTCKASFLETPKKDRPTVWSWMQKPRNAWVYYILAIHAGREGHWILIKGVKLCDTYSKGTWQFVVDGPHRRARIMEIYEVRKAV